MINQVEPNISNEDIDYFFQSIDDLLSKNISIRSISKRQEIVKKK